MKNLLRNQEGALGMILVIGFMALAVPLITIAKQIRGFVGTKARVARRAREAVAGNRRHDDVERILRRTAVREGIRERSHQPVHLDEGTRPAVEQEQRQRRWAAPRDAGEMNVEPTDADPLAR